MQKYWCLWKDNCKIAHKCVLQWTLGKQISLTRHGNSHLLPLCFCVAKYLKNVLVFLSHRQSYTQELYHAIKVNTNKIWYGNTCGKDFQIKMEATQSLINSSGKLFPEWIMPLKLPVCQSMERCYICDCCEISLNTKEVWKSHQGIHRKVRPSVCDQCGKAFQTQTAGHFHYKHFYTTDR